MFRDKPTTLERLKEVVADIGDKIVELEEQVVDRFDPTPSRGERLRRSISGHLPGHSHNSVTRYLPDFLSSWSLPTADDARHSYRGLRDQLAGFGSSVGGLRSSLPDARLPRFGSFQRGMRTQRGVDYLRERPALTGILIAGGAIAVVGAAFYVTKKVAEHTEEPDYDVVRQDGDIEIRDYDAIVVAETVKSGYHEKARRSGFETLADYISANNRSGKKIPMTAPVLQQLAEGEGQTRGWAIRFVMPKRFTKAGLPAPESGEIELKDVPAKRVVAIRFSGGFNATLASKQLMKLYNYIADENLQQKGDPEYAFYNPPWTPGFMKRNEILIEIDR